MQKTTFKKTFSRMKLIFFHFFPIKKKKIKTFVKNHFDNINILYADHKN